MLGWLRNWFLRPSPLSQWSVSISDDRIVTSDGLGTQRELRVSDLRKVVVATDDSGPWGADVVYLLYSDDGDPVGLFPLEAAGCDAFLAWMSRQPGFNDRELIRAMASTSVARFIVLDRQPESR
ncbi:hypothetical protein J2Y54_001926 [Sphingomonas sp. BE123]|uniref:hypothetical protein n=1 Tax=Sphingomonas sp. BE123 TaxID=2817842 RepID=UPI002864817D|nr:hypothetical protein [Sphingomonas sp. BE123]MDR6852406.1 hypothetical protein [Sphingomonas sp. BE123]